MIYRPFKDGVCLSVLGMGNMRLPKNDANPKEHPIDRAASAEIIEEAMQAGINYYDTAYVYNDGDSECFLGETLPKYPRDSYYIATKYHVGANPDYRDAFETQLKRLNTDHIDFYLIHCLLNNNYDTYTTNGCIEYFQEQKRLGRIRYLGFSSHANPEVMEKFADFADWDFAQIQLNYFDWMYGTAKQEYEILKSRNIPIMVMESIRGGRLSSLTPEAEALLKAREPEKSISSWALRFLMSLPGVQLMLSGMSTVDQVKDNVTNFTEDAALNEADKALLFKACEMFRSQLVVPCTGCSYCTKGCPMELPIPQIMELYNKSKTDGIGGAKRGVEALTGKPDQCIGCGACAAACPQSIDIPQVMADFAEALQ